jgi:hypothetical protein
VELKSIFIVIPEEKNVESCIRELENTVERLSTELPSLREHDTALAVEIVP